MRQSRADQLARAGLVIRDADRPELALHLKPVRVVTEDSLNGVEFDLVLLACKAYDLHAAISAIRPAVRPGTFILPLLNGMRHLDVLDDAFGSGKVLGGFCHIGATLTCGGEVRHLNRLHLLGFGERVAGCEQMAFCNAIEPVLMGSGFVACHSTTVMQEMWEKWVFISALAGSTCLMRGSVGDVTSTCDGRALMSAFLEECSSVAAAAGFPASAAFLEDTRDTLTAIGSATTASMLRDIEAGRQTEGEHVLGDLVSRAERFALATPLLRAARCHVQAYEAIRERQCAEANAPPT